MKKKLIYASAIFALLNLYACGGAGSNKTEEQIADSLKKDSLAKVNLTPHPDTTYASVKNLKSVKIDVFLKDVPGKLESYENLYDNVDGILTFRGAPSRETPFSGKVTGTPKTVKVDWEFNTGSGMTGRWGGGSGWTGQPLYVNWSDEQLKRIKTEAAEYVKPELKNKEIIVGSLAGKVFFIDFETGKASREAYNINNPIKGTTSIHPSLNGNIFVGQGINTKSPFGAVVFNLYNHKEVSFFGVDRNAWRAWGAYDSSPVAVGQFVFRPGENGTLYKLYCKGDKVKIHSTLRFRGENGNAAGMESSIAIHRNYGYVADSDGNILCVNLDNLKVVWHYRNHDDTDASIVVVEEDGVPFLYTGCEIDSQGPKGFSWFTKLNGLNGEVVWSTQIDGRCIDGKKKVEGGMFSTPLVGHGDCEGMIFSHFVTHISGRLGEFVAFDRKTGKTIYRIPLKNYSWSSPVAFYNEKNELFIFTGDVVGNVYLIRGKNGEILHTSHVGNNFESSPIVIGNKVVCGSRGTKIYKMSIE